MSTVNPTHIDIMAEELCEYVAGNPHMKPWSVMVVKHLVSKLTDAGYSIVPNAVLTELTDPDKCSFDHNGGCQAHGHFPPNDDQAWTCPVEDAKNILATAAEGEKA
ncbi:hypothetical protein CH276_14130 [Rhodococcus sp. 06-470-2]|uniref:hypothetical protein n=1 Tax=unclassified Rhodococcus (in: high G+C Gram-positive bacteria) TaxID=192944 RepID=UPI000B9AB109|nr:MULTISPECIES: hypothetical protein [unclassified Rhodococcus (in: high G+C Gram-positive bacteria)]OZC62754.1 hypothetical protein CH276_14130 [Rhodococcus sp. 06-470-2]OZE71731.1 hypothetical protein CH265_01610 [Rhodococcus sp. 05-2221-1B]